MIAQETIGSTTESGLKVILRKRIVVQTINQENDSQNTKNTSEQPLSPQSTGDWHVPVNAHETIPAGVKAKAKGGRRRKPKKKDQPSATHISSNDNRGRNDSVTENGGEISGKPNDKRNDTTNDGKKPKRKDQPSATHISSNDNSSNRGRNDSVTENGGETSAKPNDKRNDITNLDGKNPKKKDQPSATHISSNDNRGRNDSVTENGGETSAKTNDKRNDTTNDGKEPKRKDQPSATHITDISSNDNSGNKGRDDSVTENGGETSAKPNDKGNDITSLDRKKPKKKNQPSITHINKNGSSDNPDNKNHNDSVTGKGGETSAKSNDNSNDVTNLDSPATNSRKRAKRKGRIRGRGKLTKSNDDITEANETLPPQNNEPSVCDSENLASSSDVIEPPSQSSAGGMRRRGRARSRGRASNSIIESSTQSSTQDGGSTGKANTNGVASSTNGSSKDRRSGKLNKSSTLPTTVSSTEGGENCSGNSSSNHIIESATPSSKRASSKGRGTGNSDDLIIKINGITFPKRGQSSTGKGDNLSNNNEECSNTGSGRGDNGKKAANSTPRSQSSSRVGMQRSKASRGHLSVVKGDQHITPKKQNQSQEYIDSPRQYDFIDNTRGSGTPSSSRGYLSNRADSNTSWRRDSPSQRGLYSPGNYKSSPRGNNNRRNGNYSPYDEYWGKDIVEKGLEEGSILKGVFRINKRNTQECYVTVKSIEKDIFIFGSKSRNRAFEGDIVCVVLCKEEELKKLQGKRNERIEQRKDDEVNRLKKVQLPVSSSSDSINETDSPAVENPPHDYSYGNVVYIYEKAAQTQYSGTLVTCVLSNPEELEKSRKNIKTLKYFWFRPTDKKVPYIAIPSAYVPKEFIEDPDSFESTLFRAAIIKWPARLNHPEGKLFGTIGQIGEIAVESEAILLNNGITWDERFGDAEMECLPATPWEIPQSEYDNRLVLTSLDMFTIDPATAKDLDDAMHIRLLDCGNYEVGVHIADVSFFINPQNALDLEAQKRCTTVYLVQKAIPMLPRLLCEELCSLNPGVDRLSFSVIWKINPQGIVVGEPWFGKSIIRSRAKLSYDHAQAFIEGYSSWDEAISAGKKLQKLTLSDECSEQTIKEKVLELYSLSKQIRARRFDDGSLSINNFKLWFSLDSDGNPQECGVYEIKESNQLIEEFMLMANMAVAHKISTSYPELALLRRHPPPKDKPLDEFIQYVNKLGYSQFKEDEKTAGQLQRAFDQVENPIEKAVLQIIAIKPLQRAKYFCIGDEDVEMSEYRHYALNVPLYTHFTSPIRRYCDVMVHRMLDGAIKNTAGRGNGYKITEGIAIVDQLGIKSTDEDSPVESLDELYDVKSVIEIANSCNSRKDASKSAQDSSQKLYLCTYLATKYGKAGKDHTEDKPVDHSLVPAEEAIVYKVGNRSFDVLIFSLGVECRVWVEDLVDRGLVWGSEFNEEMGELKIHWKLLSDLPKDVAELEKLSEISGDEETHSLASDSENASVNGKNPKELENPSFIQTIKIFEKVPVGIRVLLHRSPPEYKVIARNPQLELNFLKSEEVGESKKICIGVIDED